MRKIFFTILLIFPAIAINAQQIEPSDSVAITATIDSLSHQAVIVDEVAAIVGGSAILLSEIETMAQRIVEKRKEEGTLSERTEKEEAFEMLLTQHLLTTRARADSLEKELKPIEPLVETEVARMVEAAGGVAELEKFYGKPIYQIKADISIDVKNSKLAEAMESNIRQKATINHGEVRKFIADIPRDSMDLIPMQYVYSQIVKSPEQTDERRYAIRERLLEFRKRILAGEITLSALARLYSSDRGSGQRGGEMGPQGAATFVGPFSEAAKALRPGEVSEIVETEYGYHLIELISYVPATNMIHVRHILLKPEFSVDESRQVESELDSITKEISAARLTFEEAALKYSTDKVTRENGGRAYNLRGYKQTGGNIRAASSRFMPDELMPADYRRLSQLKIGQISEPFETMDDQGNMIYKIVRLDKIIGAHAANIDDDYDVLESIAIQVKQSEVIEEWIREWINKTYIEIKPNYLGYELTRPEWKAAAERSAQGKNIKLIERPRPVPLTAEQLAEIEKTITPNKKQPKKQPKK